MIKIKTKQQFNSLTILLCIAYCYFFIVSLDGRWFSLEWTSDDAVQQAYPFHEVFIPNLFENDLITEVMKGYLPPIHYWLTYFLTYLTGSPIMAGHWVMFIQLSLTLFFIVLTVKNVCQAWPPALFAFCWFLHTRTAVQRLTGGFPRGWSAVVLATFLYFAVKKNHTAILLLIGFGCIMHPPSTFLIGVAYSIWLLFLLLQKDTRKNALSLMLKLALVSPIYIFILLYIIKKPDEIGQMVSYKDAINMPAFTNPGGRFPFLPLPSITWEFHHFAYNAFVNRLYDTPEWFKNIAWIIIFFALFIFALLGLKTKSQTNKFNIPIQLWSYFLAVIFVYLASRQLLFYLYVPDRHLLLPLSIFMVTIFPVALWQLAKNEIQKFLYLGFLAVFIYIGSGTGLYGDANFNYHIYRKGKAFEWLSKNTSLDAVIAGHPTHVDPVPLFAKRKVFVSSEVAHPFYPKYYAEMERRLEISLKAHYAKTIKEFLDILENEKIDYFVFSRYRFYADKLASESYYLPLKTLVQELTSRNHEDYAYKRIPKKVNIDKFPFLVFRDDQSAVVKVKLLREFYKNNKNEYDWIKNE
jgi:hypothetical protein